MQIPEPKVFPAFLDNPSKNEELTLNSLYTWDFWDFGFWVGFMQPSLVNENSEAGGEGILISTRTWVFWTPSKFPSHNLTPQETLP